METGETCNPDKSDVCNWDIVPSTITTETKSGKSVECVISPFFKKHSTSLHISSLHDEVIYDIPTDAELNLVICVNENKKVVPIGALSLEILDGQPTISMIQLVRAFTEVEVDGGYDVESGITWGNTHKKITHPFDSYVKGLDKINWQKMLIEEVENISAARGFDSIRIQSGFVSKYLSKTHSLGLLVQQYDRLVSNDSDWTPYNSLNQPIDNQTQKNLLNSTLRKLREGKISTVEEIEKLLPPESTPAYYQKNLKVN